MPRRVVLCCAAAVAVIAFAFRFISFRGFSNDQFMHLAWAQQMLHGDLPGRDFVEPGMPLMIGLSAIAQYLASGPFSEALLTEAMLALANGITCIAAAELSGSLLAGIGAGLAETAIEPRLYNYPKLLVPALTLLLVQQYVRRPSDRRVILLSAWTVAAFLFRHDLGLFAAAAVCAALAWPSGRPRRETMRALAVYVAAGLCIVAPYLVFIQATTGLAEHLRVSAEFAKAETHQMMLFDAPTIPALTAGHHLSEWGREDSTIFLYWLYHLILIAVGVALIAGRRMDGRRRAALASVFVMAVGYRLMILRDPLVGRIADVAAIIAIGGMWAFAEACRAARGMWRARPVRAALVGTTAAGIGLVSVLSFWRQPVLVNEIQETGLFKGWRGVLTQVDRQLSSRDDPGHYWPVGYPPPVVQYLRVCTATDDRVMLTWSAPEYYVLSERAFAGGHALVLAPNAFTTPHDEARILAGLTQERTPIVLVNKTSKDFFASYGTVSRYLQEHYREIGDFTIRDGSNIAIALRDDLQGVSSFDGWPCVFRQAARTDVTPAAPSSPLPHSRERLDPPQSPRR